MAIYSGTPGNDIYIGGSGPDTLSGDMGADSLRGGGGADRLSGYIVGVYELNDDGAVDRLFGEGGDDYLGLSTGDIGDGGAGNDTLVAGGAGTFTGGTGGDVLRVGNGVNIAGSVINGIERLEVSNGVFGSQMTATEFSRFGTIAGLDGIRDLHLKLTAGGTGTATIDTSVQRVTIDGSTASDNVTLATASAIGILSGDMGADSLRGGGGADRLSGYIVGVYELNDDGAVDRLFGEGGDDYLGLSTGDIGDGGAGNDTLVAGGGATLRGGDGNDLLIGSTANDSLEGGLGADTSSYERASQPVAVSLALTGPQATGGGGTDVLSGIENLIGGASNDRLTGNAGDNMIEGGVGNDTLAGGSGIDTAAYTRATTALLVDLGNANAQNTLGAGTDQLSGFENLTGGAGNDTLTGTIGANIIEGGDGNDSLVGLAGRDTASYASAGAGVAVSLAISTSQTTSGAGNDLLSGFENLRGSAFGDRLSGNAAANAIEGLDGNDTLTGGGGIDTLTGGGGNDTYVADSDDVIVESTATTGGADRVQTAVGWILAEGLENLTLTGSAAVAGTGNTMGNSMAGNGAANLLSGLAGVDVLDGGAGNDTLIGGAGTDQLRGGAGSDIFRVDLATDSGQASRDVVLDFEGAGSTVSDRVDLSRIDADVVATGNQTFTFGSRGIHGLFLSDQGTDTLVQGNIDADADFEFALLIRDGATMAAAYMASDFIL